jgi:hypothetical protein
MSLHVAALGGTVRFVCNFAEYTTPITGRCYRQAFSGEEGYGCLLRNNANEWAA